jgi:hypothetical protein
MKVQPEECQELEDRQEDLEVWFLLQGRTSMSKPNFSDVQFTN